MPDFTIPEGDADALRDGARRLASLVGAVAGVRHGALVAASRTASSGLPIRRVADFSGATQAATKTVDTIGLSASTIRGAVSAYADALEHAQDQIRRSERAWEEADLRRRDAAFRCQAEAEEECRREMLGHERRAEEARADLRDRELTVSVLVAGETHVWVPEGACSPVQAWSSANRGILPPRMQLDPARLEDAYRRSTLPREAVTTAVKAATKGWQGWQLVGWIRAASISEKAEEELAKRIMAYQLIKNTTPDLSDGRELAAYVKAEREMLQAFRRSYPTEAVRAQREYRFLRGIVSDATALRRLSERFPGLSQAQIVGVPGRLSRIVEPIRPLGPLASKVLAPVSIATGATDIWRAEDDSLPRDEKLALQVGGAGNIAAGTGTLLLMAGLVSNPVGWTIIVAGSTAAVGAWAYENRQAIEDGLEWTGGKIAEGADWTADRASDAAGWTADRASGATDLVTDAVGSAWRGIVG